MKLTVASCIMFVISGLIAGLAMTELSCFPDAWMWWALVIFPGVSYAVGFVFGREQTYKKMRKEENSNENH